MFVYMEEWGVGINFELADIFIIKYTNGIL